MMNLWQNAGDDRIAVIGGLTAMLVAGCVMYFSYFLGPQARQARRQRRQIMLHTPEESLVTACDRAA